MSRLKLFVALVCIAVLACFYQMTLTRAFFEEQQIFWDTEEESKIDISNDSTDNDSTVPTNTSLFKQDRRDKVIFCGQRHSATPMNMLLSEFKFSKLPRDSPDWDLIYGGYPHCGITDGLPPVDWAMKTGLNKHLNEQGWSNLKPHQVWFPCMGCKDSYCEKNELCGILRSTDPSSCFLLPQDMDRLKAEMDGKKLWVLKRDGKLLELHVGSGVSYVKTPEEIPDTSQGGYLVQPYKGPFLGPDNYRRKAEVRVYLAVTSVNPLRLYLYPRMWVILAASLYTSSADVEDRCIHDAHIHADKKCDGSMTPNERQMTFEDYALKSNMTIDMQGAFVKKTRELFLRVIESANPSVQKHHVNQGIKTSGASCFSYMRADLGVTDAGEPVLYEINEFPNVNHAHPAIGSIVLDSHRELFHMIGLDAPPVYGEDERAKYELAHNGQWERLVPPLE